MATIQKEILGQMVTIRCEEDDGRWAYSSDGGHVYLSDYSLPKLVDKIRGALRQKRVTVNVPVGIIRYGRPENVSLIRRNTPKDGRGREVLVKGTDGKAAEPVESHKTVYQPWDDAAMAEVKRLQDAKTAAEKAYEDYIRARVLVPATNKYHSPADAGAVVDKAVEAKMAAQAAQEAAIAKKAALDALPPLDEILKANGNVKPTLTVSPDAQAVIDKLAADLEQTNGDDN